MKTCPCGCGREVKGRNTYAARGCAVLAVFSGGREAMTVEPRQAQRGTPITCATCPSPLSVKERNSGCRRCLACRIQTPGRQTTIAQLRHAPKSRPTNSDVFAGGRKTEVQAKANLWGDSWWVGMDRPAFMATAYAKHPSVTPPISYAIDRSAGGRSDL